MLVVDRRAVLLLLDIELLQAIETLIDMPHERVLQSASTAIVAAAN